MGKIITGTPPGGERVRLAEVLPLATPLVIQIFPAYLCNMRCKFCHFAIPHFNRRFISDRVFMSAGMYAKVIEDMKQFDGKVRVLRFVGMGEPLMHEHLITMVNYAKLLEVADRVEILTNALLLDSYTTDGLLDAGLDRLVVSIQGTSPERYKEMSGVEIAFAKFLGQLEYFYERKGECNVHIKIIDCALTSPEDEQRYYHLFSPLCDTIGVERVGPIYGGVPMNDEMDTEAMTQFGVPASEVKVCPQAFATLQVNPDGKVVPCYSIEYPTFLGDVNDESIVDIWNGERLREFRCRMLSGRGEASENCKNCQIIGHRMFPEDRLDDDTYRLKGVYGCL